MGDKPLEQMKTALESAPNVDCKEVMIREATTIGDDDNYEEWRGGWKYDFSSFSPNTGYLFGVGPHPVPAVDPGGPGQSLGSAVKSGSWRVKGCECRDSCRSGLGNPIECSGDNDQGLHSARPTRKKRDPGHGVPGSFREGGQFPYRSPTRKRIRTGCTRALLPRLTSIGQERRRSSFSESGVTEKWLPAFPPPLVSLQELVHSSAKAVFGIAAGYGIQLPVVRDEPLV